MNVIIKGIDPNTVGAVTDLVSDLQGDPDAIKRLEPLVDDSQELEVPQTPRQEGGVDPAPDDLPTGGEPIDYSAASEPSPSPKAAPGGGSAMQLERRPLHGRVPSVTRAFVTRPTVGVAAPLPGQQAPRQRHIQVHAAQQLRNGDVLAVGVRDVN
jgi:hypothetical protein